MCELKSNSHICTRKCYLDAKRDVGQKVSSWGTKLSSEDNMSHCKPNCKQIPEEALARQLAPYYTEVSY
jgi:hypothetical protein